MYSDHNEVTRVTDGVSNQSYHAFENKADARADFQANRSDGGGNANAGGQGGKR